MTELSNRLKELKVTRNLLQKDIANALEIPLRTYQRYEYGEQEPIASTLVKMADYFQVSVDYLLGRTDEK